MMRLTGRITDRQLVEQLHTAADRWESPRPGSPAPTAAPPLPPDVDGTAMTGRQDATVAIPAHRASTERFGARVARSARHAVFWCGITLLVVLLLAASAASIYLYGEITHAVR